MYLSVIRAVTERVAVLHGLDAPAVEEVKLAVDEACSNVIKYAYGGDTEKRIRVTYGASHGAFEVSIDDDGAKTSPEAVVGRDLDDVRVGGLGIHFIKRAFDGVVFDGRKKRGNRLRLVRHKNRTS
jgi:anti-sigma regulatory factor (Ser/Thr protein kinase)